MAITLDYTKKQMILSADEFLRRWGYPITESELKTAVKAHGHTITKQGWLHDMSYLIDCGLLRGDSKAILATSTAVKSISELDNFDA
ncbi:MAG TPA: hypothetical protein PK129_01920 [Cellvibrionaceae bacterium]|nr:hypothetical protein [Cellvibrionaceae bacterium]